MLNAVGLQGPGIEYWLEHVVPDLRGIGGDAWSPASGAGRSTTTARRPTCSPRRPDCVVAVEVNLSCPNLEGRRSIFAHDPDLSAEVIAATAGCGRPRWAKLSANTDRIVDVASGGRRSRGGGGDVHQHDARASPTTPKRCSRRSPPAAGACRAGRSIRSPCGPSTTSRPRCPICRSSGSAGWRPGWDAAEMLLAGADRGAGRHGAVRRSGRTGEDPGGAGRLGHTGRAFAASIRSAR